MPEVRIERLPDGAVIVRHEYAGNQRTAGAKVAAAVCLVFACVPVAVWLFFHDRPAGSIPVLIAVIIAGIVIERILTQFTATRSCLLHADGSGLTIDVTSWRKQTIMHLDTSEVHDIALDGRCTISLSEADLTNRMFRSMLVVTPSSGPAIHCLHNVSGDQLARVADALRMALGMPVRSWP